MKMTEELRQIFQDDQSTGPLTNWEKFSLWVLAVVLFGPWLVILLDAVLPH